MNSVVTNPILPVQLLRLVKYAPTGISKAKHISGCTLAHRNQFIVRYSTRTGNMKEAIVSKGPKVEIVDSPIPKPNAGQVLIKVVFSGSNPKVIIVDIFR